MKLLLLLVLLPFGLSAQKLDSCGLNNRSLLNAQEAAYFNTRHEDTRGEFSFLNKRLIFITGEAGGMLGSKRGYFDDVKKWQAAYKRNDVGGSSLIVLTEAQRLQSNGYDAIVTYWTIVHPSADHIIKRVNRKATKHQYPLPD
ncbi:hypothetical protein [Hymenobacter siberiensis]|uniref:hypothetical protein n=1 Tax=Hymenobacter siberiensis TaxID=2848396 RepID=UPI001C1E62C1|nr:hypothetical protein [Hymenobacter siberiensis]MBU6122695.1 hypothetical protein [Hymenobacter siberiensis]